MRANRSVDLTKFTLADMTELGAALRRLGDAARTMEETATRIVRHLYDSLVDAGAYTPGCVLVRFFKTQAYAELPPDLRDLVQERLQRQPPTPALKCLILLATAGAKPEWNSRQASVAHQAIALGSREMLSRMPMISGLLQQLGVQLETSRSANVVHLVEPQPSSFNVFYVPEAATSPYIPDQDGFVKPLAIRSVLGFGGLLPRGDIFSVILFSRVLIPRETAELFRTLALNVRMAVAPFDQAVFRAETASAGTETPDPGSVAERARSRIDALEQLLEVYEHSVAVQSQRLEVEQERMRLQKSLLEAQGEAALDGILSIGIDQKVLFANRRLCEMWGISAPRVGTRSYRQVLRSLAERTSDPAGFVAGAAALDSHEKTQREISLRDGRTFEKYSAPIVSGEARCVGRVWYFRDITASQRIARTKDEFISAVSHELRTPLTSIRGSLDLMASGELGEFPPEATTMIKVAQRSCERLVRLVNDVLDVEKLEAGAMDFRLRVVEMQPLVEQAVESMQAYADQLGVGLRISSSAAECRVQVDPDRVMQVLENLLSNAIKFSPPGEAVQIAVCRAGAGVRVSVTDRGPGIDRDLRPRLFEKFAQGACREPRQRGTGLGLNIARTIVEQLGGTISFASKPGVETSFYFDLPEWRAGRGPGRAS